MRSTTKPLLAVSLILAASPARAAALGSKAFVGPIVVRWAGGPTAPLSIPLKLDVSRLRMLSPLPRGRAESWESPAAAREPAVAWAATAGRQGASASLFSAARSFAQVSARDVRSMRQEEIHAFGAGLLGEGAGIADREAGIRLLPADSSEFVGAYLRPDKPLPFGERQMERYVSLLIPTVKDMTPAAERALVRAAEELLESAGVVLRSRHDPGEEEHETHPGFLIAPVNGASALNDLARDLDKAFGMRLAYVPGLLGEAAGAFDAGRNLLLLPHFGRPDSFPILLHEILHQKLAHMMERGRASLLKVTLAGTNGRNIAPRAKHYQRRLDLDELATFPKTLRHLLSALRAARDPRLKEKLAGSLPRKTEFLRDIIRSARHVLGQLDELEDSDELMITRHSDWAPDLGLGRRPPSGHFYVAALPQGVAVFPLREKGIKARLFGLPEEERGEELAAHVKALKALLDEIEPQVEEFERTLLLASEAGLDPAESQRIIEGVIAAVARRDRAWIGEVWGETR